MEGTNVDLGKKILADSGLNIINATDMADGARKAGRGGAALAGRDMSILVDKSTKVVTQGITGATGQFHTRACREYGTQMVAGVTPGKGGSDFEGIPIFDTVAQARDATGCNASVIYVPPPFARTRSWRRPTPA
jgi:hypothetical protein